MEANVIGDDERYRGRFGAWTRLQFDRIQYLTCLIVQDVSRWVIGRMDFPDLPGPEVDEGWV